MNLFSGLSMRLTLVVGAVMLLGFFAIAVIFPRSAAIQFESIAEALVASVDTPEISPALIEKIKQSLDKAENHADSKEAAWLVLQETLPVALSGIDIPGIWVLYSESGGRSLAGAPLQNARVTFDEATNSLQLESESPDQFMIQINDIPSVIVGRQGGLFGNVRLFVLPPLDAAQPEIQSDIETEFSEGLRQKTYLYLLIALLVLLPVTYLGIKVQLTPIRNLTRATQTISDGVLPEPIPVRGAREVRELTQHFNQAVARLRHDETLRKRMIADISHELRTPLSILMAQIEAVSDGVLALDTELIDSLGRQTGILSRLVEDLQDLALADANALTLHMVDIDLNNEVQMIVDAFNRTGTGDRVRFTPASDIKLSADPVRLGQVISNLIKNAFTHGGDQVSVSVQTRIGKNAAVVEICDDGPGIPADVQEHVFERFYQAEASRSGGRSGAGLGLAVVKSLVETQGGSVTFTSQPGETRFMVRFPMN